MLHACTEGLHFSAFHYVIVCVPFVEASDSFGHFWIGSGCRGFSLLGYLVQSIHVRLVSGHFFLKGLEREGGREGGREGEGEGEGEGERERFVNLYTYMYVHTYYIVLLFLGTCILYWTKYQKP